VDDIAPCEGPRLTGFACLDVLHFLPSSLEIGHVQIAAKIINLVWGILHVFNDDEVRVENDALRDSEEVLSSVLGDISHRKTATVSQVEVGGRLGSTVDKELDCLRHALLGPVEGLSILRSQDHHEVRLVHIEVGLAKEDVLRALVTYDVLGRHLHHPCEHILFLSCHKNIQVN
jgi:hypothetical protein